MNESKYSDAHFMLLYFLKGRTWDFRDTKQEEVQLAITSSTGRPVKSNVDLWIGPDWTPFTMKAYSEDGGIRPIQCILGTRGKVAQVCAILPVQLFQFLLLETDMKFRAAPFPYCVSLFS